MYLLSCEPLTGLKIVEGKVMSSFAAENEKMEELQSLVQ